MKILTDAKLRRRDYCPAAKCWLSFDRIIQSLGVAKGKGLHSEDGGRLVILALSTGRHAILRSEGNRPAFEVELEIANDEFFYEEDLIEIISALEVDEEYFKRYQNDFTWVPVGGKP